MQPNIGGLEERGSAICFRCRVEADIAEQVSSILFPLTLNEGSKSKKKQQPEQFRLAAFLDFKE